MLNRSSWWMIWLNSSICLRTLCVGSGTEVSNNIGIYLFLLSILSAFASFILQLYCLVNTNLGMPFLSGLTFLSLCNVSLCLWQFSLSRSLIYLILILPLLLSFCECLHDVFFHLLLSICLCIITFEENFWQREYSQVI